MFKARKPVLLSIRGLLVLGTLLVQAGCSSQRDRAAATLDELLKAVEGKNLPRAEELWYFRGSDKKTMLSDWSIEGIKKSQEVVTEAVRIEQKDNLIVFVALRFAFRSRPQTEVERVTFNETKNGQLQMYTSALDSVGHLYFRNSPIDSRVKFETFLESRAGKELRAAVEAELQDVDTELLFAAYVKGKSESKHLIEKRLQAALDRALTAEVEKEATSRSLQAPLPDQTARTAYTRPGPLTLIQARRILDELERAASARDSLTLSSLVGDRLREVYIDDTGRSIDFARSGGNPFSLLKVLASDERLVRFDSTDDFAALATVELSGDRDPYLRVRSLYFGRNERGSFVYLGWSGVPVGGEDDVASWRAAVTASSRADHLNSAMTDAEKDVGWKMKARSGLQGD